MKKKSDGAKKLLEGIVNGMFEKGAHNVLKIDLRKLESRIADYYLVCHGSSATQVEAIADSVEDMVRKSVGEKPLHVEGLENCFWVLLDYSNVVVHVFLEEHRNFYNLESLWADAAIETMVDKGKKV